MRFSFVLRRITARAGVAVWRQRIGWLVAAFAVAAFGLYQMTYALPARGNGDCADATMASVTQVDDALARAAYACLGPGMRTSSEDQFVANMEQRSLPPSHVSRVGEQNTSDGGRIVFFTVDSQSSSVGYIVYLDSDGQVVKVE